MNGVNIPGFRFNPTRTVCVSLDDARCFLPHLSNNDSLRNWLLRRPHIQRRRGQVCLPDLLNELESNNG